MPVAGPERPGPALRRHQKNGLPVALRTPSHELRPAGEGGQHRGRFMVLEPGENHRRAGARVREQVGRSRHEKRARQIRQNDVRAGSRVRSASVRRCGTEVGDGEADGGCACERRVSARFSSAFPTASGSKSMPSAYSAPTPRPRAPAHPSRCRRRAPAARDSRFPASMPGTDASFRGARFRIPSRAGSITTASSGPG